MSNSLEYEINQASEGQKLVGHVVTWSINRATISAASLAVEAARLGIQGNVMPVVTAEQALKRAVRKFLRENSFGKVYVPSTDADYDDSEDDDDQTGKQNYIKGYNSNAVNAGSSGSRSQLKLVRKIKGTDKKTIGFGIVLEDNDTQSFSLQYGTELRVVLNTKTKNISVSQRSTGLVDQEETETIQTQGQLSLAIINAKKKITADYLWYSKNYVSLDIATFIKKAAIRLYGVSLRPMGGVYFVPDTESKKLWELKKIVETKFGAINQSSMTCLALVDTSENKGQIASITQEALKQELEVLKVDMSTLQKDSAETEMRVTTVAERLTKYQILRYKACAVAQALDLEVEDILGKIGALEDEASNLMQAVTKSASIRRELGLENKKTKKASSSSEFEIDYEPVGVVDEITPL